MRGLTIDGKTKIAGVIGYPVAHTLSPAMQNAAFAAKGINAVYLPLAASPKDLQRLLRTLAGLGALGVNITIPHKQHALQLVDACDSEARRIGAVNTIAFRRGKLTGYNTDGLGFLAAIAPAIRLKNQRVVLLGAGGAGRSVAVSLARSGVGHLTISEPNPNQRRRLESHLRQLNFTAVESLAPGSERLEKAVREAGLVVNASPLGLMTGDPLPVPWKWLVPGRCVMDLVYGRGWTPWLRGALRRGCRIVPGWHMLLHQGAAAFRIWTGGEPPLQVMRTALIRAGV